MKRLIYISAVILLLVPYSLYFLFLQFSISFHKQEVRLNIRNGNYITENITFNYFNKDEKQKINFLNSKEFIYNNKLYDIVRIEVSGNKLMISCVSDTKEKQLISKITEEMNNDNNVSNKKVKKLKFSFPVFSICEKVLSDLPCFVKNICRYHYINYIDNIGLPVFPPPKML